MKKRIVARINAFTLIELLVVILIIGILAAVALPQYQKAVAKSRFASIKPIAKSIKDTLEIYFETHGEYADDINDLDIQISQEGPVHIIPIRAEGTLGVAAYDERIENNLYAIILAHSPNLANNTYCAFNGENAEPLCKAEGVLDAEASAAFGFGMYRISGNSGMSSEEGGNEGDSGEILPPLEPSPEDPGDPCEGQEICFENH